MKAACLVYVTTASRAEADRIAAAAVDEKLAACANVLGRIESVFSWQGAVRREDETALILKTSHARLDALTARVVDLHSYDAPCVIALPILGGSQGFIDWIVAETGGE